MTLDELERDSEMAAQGRFVILQHDWPEPHRDLIVELRNLAGADRLPTWALYPERLEDRFFPTDRPLAGRAVPLDPHRREYLDYEGPVSGDRGEVKRECHGVVIDSESDEAGASIRIELAFIEAGAESTPGELRIVLKPKSRLIRDIPVGANHSEAAAEGHIFQWQPKGGGRSSEVDSVA